MFKNSFYIFTMFFCLINMLSEKNVSHRRFFPLSHRLLLKESLEELRAFPILLPRTRKITQYLILCHLYNFRGYFAHPMRKLSQVLVFIFTLFPSRKEIDGIAKVSYSRNYILVSVTRYASWRQSNGLKLIFTLAQRGLQPRNVIVVSLIGNIISCLLRASLE